MVRFNSVLAEMKKTAFCLSIVIVLYSIGYWLLHLRCGEFIEYERTRSDSKIDFVKRYELHLYNITKYNSLNMSITFVYAPLIYLEGWIRKDKEFAQW